MPVVVMYLSYLMIRFLTGQALSLSASVLILIGGALVALLHPYLFRLRIRRQVRALDRIGGYKAFLGTHILTINPDGVRSVTDIGESFYKWGAITSVAQGKDQIYLFVSEAAALPIPRRAFADTAQEASFLAEVERYRAGAVASPVSLSLNPVATSMTKETPQTPISNAPWWSGQTAATLDAEAQSRTQRNGGQ